MCHTRRVEGGVWKAGCIIRCAEPICKVHWHGYSLFDTYIFKIQQHLVDYVSIIKHLKYWCERCNWISKNCLKEHSNLLRYLCEICFSLNNKSTFGGIWNGCGCQATVIVYYNFKMYIFSAHCCLYKCVLLRKWIFDIFR